MADSEEFLVRFELDVSSAVTRANELSVALSKVTGALGTADAASKKMQASTGAAAAATGRVGAAAKTAGGQITTLSGKTYQNAAALEAASKQTALYNQYLYDQSRGHERLIQNLSNTRYALYDASRVLGLIGAALLAIPIASVATAISFERDFANVRRTAQVTGQEAKELQKSLIDLSLTIPSSFGDITEIAALGGQLGIASGDLDEFTSVVAKLEATTDLTAEAAGTMLGRFQALLGIRGDQFEALASSILKVGINSVATESQIVEIATQISSMGDFAGLTADQVVGLSGALASVGAAPEISRGTITRVFTNMSRAIASGGDRLDEFARISRVSSSEFASAFGTNRFGAIFQSFLKGLNTIGEQGENTVSVLNSLGITSVRDVPLLLRLAGAGDVVANSFSDAAEGFARAKELQDQYGIVAETTAAKLQILFNAIQKFLNTLGNQATGPLNDFLDLITGALSGLSDFLSTDAGQKVAILTISIAALLGVLALLGATLALASAGTIALTQSTVALRAIWTGSVPAGSLMGRVLTGIGVSSTAASRGVRLLGAAFGALGLVSLVAILPDVANGIDGIIKSMQGIDTSDIEASIKRIKDDFFNDALFQAGNPN